MLKPTVNALSGQHRPARLDRRSISPTKSTLGSATNFRVVLASALYFPNVGGVENSLHQLGVAFGSRSVPVWVLSSTSGDASADARLFDVRRIRGIPTFRYQATRLSLLRVLRAGHGLSILSRKFGRSTVIARDEYTALAAALMGQPCIYLVPGLHTEQHRYAGPNPIRRLNRRVSAAIQFRALTRVGSVVVFSNRLAESIAALGVHRQVFRVRPGVDTSRFKPLAPTEIGPRRASLGIPVASKVAIVMGRLAGVKRVDLAVDAMAVAPRDRHMLIVGDGPCRQSLEQRVRELGLGDRVKFVGNTHTPEKYLQAADVLLLPSESETYGQVLLEGMACGLKVAAFDPNVPGIHTATAEVVPEEWLFTAGRKDGAALCDAMERALGSGRDTERIATWAQGTFSWDALAHELLRIGDQVEAAGPCPILKAR